MGGGPYGGVVQWGGVFLCDPAPFPHMRQSENRVELSGILWGAGLMEGWSNGVACPCATPPLSHR